MGPMRPRCQNFNSSRERTFLLPPRSALMRARKRALRSAVNGLNTPDRVALTIGLIASRPNPTDHKFAYNGFLGPDLSSTTWADLDVYDTVWGSLGTPDAFRIPGEGADGAMMVLPRVRGGGLEVVVALESRAMACLLADEEFLSWAEVRL